MLLVREAKKQKPLRDQVAPENADAVREETHGNEDRELQGVLQVLQSAFVKISACSRIERKAQRM